MNFFPWMLFLTFEANWSPLKINRFVIDDTLRFVLIALDTKMLMTNPHQFLL